MFWLLDAFRDALQVLSVYESKIRPFFGKGAKNLNYDYDYEPFPRIQLLKY